MKKRFEEKALGRKLAAWLKSLEGEKFENVCLSCYEMCVEDGEEGLRTALWLGGLTLSAADCLTIIDEVYGASPSDEDQGGRMMHRWLLHFRDPRAALLEELEEAKARVAELEKQLEAMA